MWGKHNRVRQDLPDNQGEKVEEREDTGLGKGGEGGKKGGGEQTTGKWQGWTWKKKGFT